MSSRDACKMKLRVKELATSRIVTAKSTFVNNNPNLNFTFPDGMPYGFATDDEGTQYLYDWISLGGQVIEKHFLEIDKQFYTGTRLKASIRFINVLPQVERLKVVRVPFSKQLSGTYNFIYSDLFIRILGIKWK